MGDDMSNILNKVKTVAKSFTKTIVKTCLPIILIVVLLASFVYYLTVWVDGIGEDEDWSNTRYAVSQYTNDITIAADGKITSSMSAKELWDKMLDEESRVNLYLKKPEELLKLMNAELVTQFLDTRNNPDDPIDWDSINDDPDNKEIQGIIKLKRKFEDGTTTTLKYVSPSTFQSYIDDYNLTGNATAKQKALTHFTIEENEFATPPAGGGAPGAPVVSTTPSPVSPTPVVTSDEWKWPTDGTRISSYFGPRTDPISGGGANHGAIDIPVPIGTNVYAADGGTVIFSGWQNKAGNAVTIDHGNGYKTKYFHNSSLKVSVGDVVTKGQVIALAGSTGYSTGPHVHFQVEYNGTKVDPLNFKYDNGMGDGSYSPSSPISGVSASSASKYYAVVASWNETRDIVTSNDPDVLTYDKTTYTMSTTNINYQDLVRGYTMPFDYLWAMLVVSEDKDFTFDLADLVYNSKIEITVHDNLSTNTNVKVETYTEKKKTITDAKVTVNGYKDDGTVDTISKVDDWEDIDDFHRTTTSTKITKTNTLDIAVTLADVWMAKYTQDYTREVPADVTSSSSETLADLGYPVTPNETTTLDSKGHAHSLLASQKAYMNASGVPYTSVTGYINYVNESIYYATVNRKEDCTNTLKSTKYVASAKVVEEKVDKTAPEPNFVTIFLKYENTKARNNILSVESWLFEIIETNKSTENLSDLTKYLLYKATDKDYGVTDFDFDAYSNKVFSTVTGIYGGTIQEKIWFALIDAGFSEYSAAGVLGNIAQESGFNASAENGIGAIGMCQWLGARKTQLIAYANSKGVDWKDEDTQIEYLIAEVTPGGKGIATYQFSGFEAYRSQWVDATNTDGATEGFCWGFERCGVHEANMPYRKSQAANYYTQFHGRTVASGDSRIGDIRLSGSNANKMLAMLTEACRIADDSRYTYSQPNRMTEFQYDCSSLLYRLYKQYFGIELPLTTHGYLTSSPYYIGAYGSVTLQPGDALWKPGHIEMYLGNGYRVGAHSDTLPIARQISVEPLSGFTCTRVYRFIN